MRICYTHHMDRNRNGAFSLVEMMVVLGIIAVLGGIALSCIRPAFRAANLAACTSNLRQIWVAMNLYATDNGECYPVGWNAATNTPFASLLQSYTGADLTNPHNLFVSPAALPITATDGLPYDMTYAMNGQLGNGSAKRVLVSRQSEVILVANAVQDPNNFERSACTIYQPDGVYSSSTSYTLSDPIPVQTAVGNLDYPHSGRVNCVFVDGHIEPIKKGEVTWGNLLPIP